MAGYTRQDTANNIANGNVIDADDFDAEYNAIEGAFNSSAGHTHDGTSGEGAPITVVGPAQDVVVSGTKVEAKTHNAYDLGSDTVRFKDAYLSGNASIGGNLTVTGNATINGNLTFGDAATDTVAFGADINSSIIPDVDDTYDLGSATQQWRNLYIDGTANIDSLVADTADINGGTANVASLVATTADINGGTLDGVTIGGTTAGAITGTTITGTSFVGPLTGNVTGNASTASRWQAARSITLTGDVTGTISGVDGSGDISIATTVAPNRVALGTDTTGDYIQKLVAGTGVTLTGNSGEGSSPTVAIGQNVSTTSNVTFNSVVVSGNLTVSGTTTTVNTETIQLADNIITLNSNETGTPSQNTGIEVERGLSINKTLLWDETSDKWTVGSETFVAGTFEGNVIGNLTGTIVTGAQPYITSVGNLNSLTVDSLTLNSNTFLSSSDINLDAQGGDIFLKKSGSIAGSIGLNISNTLQLYAGTIEAMRLATNGVTISKGLHVGSATGTPTDNDIYAEADITAGNNLTAGNDIIMTAGSSDWRFEVGASGELTIYSGINKLFKLDASGNLTVAGDITAFGTV